MINVRIDDIVASVDKNRTMLEIAQSYRGNWRDIVVFICAVLFTIVWWNVSHSRTNWELMFITMILLSIVAGVYAGRGIFRAIRTLAKGGDEKDQ